MSHDRGCFRCFEDHPTHAAKTCTIAGCPYKEEPITVEHPEIDRIGRNIAMSARTSPAYAAKPMTAQEALEKAQQPILALSWQSIHDAIDSLYYQIQPLKPHLIVAIARGGLIPGTLLSHKLNVCVEVVHASAYQGTRRALEKPITVEGWKTEYNHHKVIIVDDILDSGDTYRAIQSQESGALFHARYAVLVHKIPNERLVPIHYARVPKDVWVKFPWESDET